MTAATPQTQSILVIDDEPDLATTIRRILEWGGYKVSCSGTGTDGLARLRAEAFDFIITDIFMPDVDGPQIIAAARKYQPASRVIAISGGGSYMSSPDALNVARKLGADASLMKPFTPSQLLELIKGIPPK